jgi:hypothetical protein
MAGALAAQDKVCAPAGYFQKIIAGKKAWTDAHKSYTIV